MSKIFRATQKLPPVIVLHGLPGVGKTTLAASFPAPVFLQAVVDALKHLGTQPHDFKTVVIDSLDKLQPLIFAAVCAEHGYANIETPGYRRGYLLADTPWSDTLRACDWLRRTRGMTIVLIAHSEIVTVNDPRVVGYTSYQLRLHRRARGLVEDAADLIGFLATDIVVKSEQGGFGKTRARADGGSTRWLHTEGRPAFVAKNRYAMPERIAIPQRFDFQNTLGKFFPQPQADTTSTAAPQPKETRQ
jgi:hypothetical protein